MPLSRAECAQMGLRSLLVDDDNPLPCLDRNTLVNCVSNEVYDDLAQRLAVSSTAQTDLADDSLELAYVDSVGRIRGTKPPYKLVLPLDLFQANVHTAVPLTKLGQRAVQDKSPFVIEQLAEMGQDLLPSRVCCHCGRENSTKKCTGCKLAYYCDQYCQKHDWADHKVRCKASVQTKACVALKV